MDAETRVMENRPLIDLLHVMWSNYTSPGKLAMARADWSMIRPRVPIQALDLIESIDSNLANASARSQIDRRIILGRVLELSTWMSGYEAGRADGPRP